MHRITKRVHLAFFIFLFSFSLQVSAQDKLLFALDLIRHGDRTPIYELPNLAYPWNEGKGQLTAQGIAQELQLGIQLRKKYVDHFQLLPKHYQHRTLYVRSTDFDRTLMSAQAVLMGLYPQETGPLHAVTQNPIFPGGYQPIPIHSKCAEHDELIPLTFDRAQELFKRYAWNQKVWKEKTAQLQPKFAVWSKAIGIPINNIYQLVRISDTFYVYQQHQIPLNTSLSTSEVNEIIEAGAWAFSALFRPQEIGSTLGIELLETINTHLQKASQLNSELKYVLLSGHDSTILSLLSAIQAPLHAPPPYGSVLNFSLFSADTRQYISVRFNDKPIFIPYCQGSTCTLRQFEELMRNTREYSDPEFLKTIQSV